MEEREVLQEATTVADNTLPKQEVAEQERAVAPNKPVRKFNKSLFLNIFCIVTIVVTLFFMSQLSKDLGAGDQKSLGEILANVNVGYLVLSLATILLVMTLDVLKYVIIMRTTLGNRAKFPTAVKASLMGKFYDNITPFASGGQPMQIVYLHGKKLSGGESTAVVMIRFAFHLACWLTTCAVLMIFNGSALDQYVTDTTQHNLYTVAGWVGFGINCLIPLTVLAFVLFPKISESIAKGILWLGAKLRLVKDRDKQLARIKKSIDDFVGAFKTMATNPLRLALLVICCILDPLLSMMLPFFVIVAFAGNAVIPSVELMLAIMTLYVYVSMSVTIVPTPGNSGALENAFMLTLTTIASEVLFWSVLGWRFLSYYTYVIIGLTITIGDMFRRQRRAKLQKKMNL